jgi:hypothetical protein
MSVIASIIINVTSVARRYALTVPTSLMDAREMLQHQVEVWAKLMPERGQTFDQWLLDNGEVCGPARSAEKLGTPKQCYENSFNAVQFFSDCDLTEWFYTEGVVLRDNMPLAINHAWLTNRQGEVIDVTLRDADQCTYFGIPFDPDYLLEATEQHGYYGLFSDGAMYNRDIVFKPVPAAARAWPRRNIDKTAHHDW